VFRLIPAPSSLPRVSQLRACPAKVTRVPRCQRRRVDTSDRGEHVVRSGQRVTAASGISRRDSRFDADVFPVHSVLRTADPALQRQTRLRANEALRLELPALFNHDRPPSPQKLLIEDGFDVLDKERAGRFFTCKSWKGLQNYLHAIHQEPCCGGACHLEEWVAAPRVQGACTLRPRGFRCCDLRAEFRR